MTPPAPHARFVGLDVCRGLAVLGILIVNAIAFAQPFEVYENPVLSVTPLSAADISAWWAIETFGKQKFYTLLAMLFGVGLYLSTVPSGEAAHAKPVPLTADPLFKRQMWLMVIGCLHGFLIWDGDILLLYGLTGLFMWNWRYAKGSRLLLYGGLLYLLGTALLLWTAFSINRPGLELDTQPLVDKIFGIRAGFTRSLDTNAKSFGLLIMGQISLYAPQTLGLMMLGVGLYKTGFLRGLDRALPYWVFAGLAVVSLALIGWQNYETLRDGFRYPDVYTTGLVNNQILSLLVSMGYISLILLALRSSLLKTLLKPLALCGRMSLSVYILQSLIMTALFYGGRAPEGFDLPLLGRLPLYGRLNIADLLPLVVCVWMVCVLFCAIWLRFFHYGPMEWLWRRLWRGQPVPFLKRLDIRV